MWLPVWSGHMIGQWWSGGQNPTLSLASWGHVTPTMKCYWLEILWKEWKSGRAALPVAWVPGLGAASWSLARPELPASTLGQIRVFHQPQHPNIWRWQKIKTIQGFGRMFILMSSKFSKFSSRIIFCYAHKVQLKLDKKGYCLFSHWCSGITLRLRHSH